MEPFDVPVFIQQPTGRVLCDVAPLLSLLPCCTTLNLFRKTGRYTDLVLFSVGFWLALVYHWCQMQPEGLYHANMFGVSGEQWRTFDVLFCLVLLTRTMGHIFGAIDLPFSSLPNIVFPVALILIYVTSAKAEMSSLVILAVSTMLTTALLMVLVKKPTSSVVLFLFLPNLFGQYWMFHSLWHLLLAAGYHILYSELERPKLTKINGKLH